jgi:putative tryptophan/tyrosine transport system substrate-binding protein
MKANISQVEKMKRIGALCLIFGGLFLFLSGCSPEAKTYRVGIVSSLSAFNAIADGFKDGMTELGYIEGENITYDFQQSSEDLSELQPIMDRLVADNVDMIFTFPTGATVAAKAATANTDIPVIFAFAVLEGSDLVDSLREPGGNLTGVRFPGPDLTVNRLELLLEMAPETERVLLLHDPAYPASVSALEALEEAAPSLGVELLVVPLTGVADILPGLEAHTSDGNPDFDAILIMPEGFVQSPDGWPIVANYAAEHQIPIGGSADFEAEAGAIFSHIPDSYETGKLAAPLADKVFQDIPAANIPVLTPDSQFHVNVALANEMGLSVPDRLLSLATDIIR